MTKKTIFLGFLILILAFIAVDNGIKKVYYKEIAVESLVQMQIVIESVERWRNLIKKFGEQNSKQLPNEKDFSKTDKKTFDI